VPIVVLGAERLEDELRGLQPPRDVEVVRDELGHTTIVERRRTPPMSSSRFVSLYCVPIRHALAATTPGGRMKLLLTSAGIQNPSIHDALVDLLGKPIGEADALCITTASYAHPMAGPARAWSFISGTEPRCPMTELGWKSMGVLELTALPSIGRERWETW